MNQHPLPHLLCPHSLHTRNGAEVSLQCTLSKIPQFPCCFTRYCTTERTLKMVPAYQEKCKFLISPKDGETEMSKKKNPENPENPETPETIETTKEFEIIESIEELHDAQLESTEQDETVNESVSQPLKVEMCKVLYVKPNILAFDFKGYGIHISTEHLLDQEIIPTKFIEVEYESDIGKPDFKYYLKFQ